jgi:hypothetical protein
MFGRPFLLSLAIAMLGGCFSEASGSSPGGCRPGEQLCPCDDERCEAGLTCSVSADVCVAIGCEVGALECPCGMTGACNPGLMCLESKYCAPADGSTGAPTSMDTSTQTSMDTSTETTAVPEPTCAEMANCGDCVSCASMADCAAGYDECVDPTNLDDFCTAGVNSYITCAQAPDDSMCICDPIGERSAEVFACFAATCGELCNCF